MNSEKVKMSSSNITVRSMEYNDFKQVSDLYYRYLSGDVVGSCGPHILLNYLKFMKSHHEGALMCAVTEKQRVIGFAVGIIDKQRMNRQWLRKNMILLIPVIMTKFLFSRQFRKFIYNRYRDIRSGGGGFAETTGSNKVGRRAYSMWAAVDESYRGKSDHVAARLLASIEEDVKNKGASQIYSFVNRTNLASIFMHMKNGWKVIDKNEKRFKLAKDLK